MYQRNNQRLLQAEVGIDLITANGFSSTNTLTVYTNDGSGVFTLAATLVVPSVPFSSYPQPVLVADVNGDSKPDILCLDQHNVMMEIFTNAGSATFGSYTNFSVNIGGAAAATVFAVADVNGDGKPDLMIGYNSVNLLTVLTNCGGGIFTSNKSYNVGPQPVDVELADINGDGKLDIVVSCSGTCPGNGPPCSNGSLTILTNNGSGVFGTAATLTGGVWTLQAAIGDANGDGKLDLVCANVGYSGYANSSLIEFFDTSVLLAPTLKSAKSGNQIVFTWPSSAGTYALQTNNDLRTTNWTSYAGPVSDNSLMKSVTNTPAASRLFFRLKQ